MPVHLLSPRDIKAEARNFMRNAQVSPLKFTLLYLIALLILDEITAVSDFILGSSFLSGIPFFSLSFIGILSTLIANVFSAGYNCYTLGILRGDKMPYESLFDGFSFAGKVIGLLIVEGIFVFLWSLLFLIPGIIAIYRYSFALWNLCQNPNLGIFEALNLSKVQTDGYKAQLFFLQLNFIGWFLLAALIGWTYSSISLSLIPPTLSGILIDTLLLAFLSGILDFYLVPYMSFSTGIFYRCATTPIDTSSSQQSKSTDPWDTNF